MSEYCLICNKEPCICITSCNTKISTSDLNSIHEAIKENGISSESCECDENCNCDNENCNCENEDDYQYDNAISLDLTDVACLKYNYHDFRSGVNDYSYVAGAITALLNAGLSKELAIDYLCNEKNANHNIKVNEINCEASKFTAKMQNLLNEKGIL